MNWFEIKNSEKIDSPALIFYLDRVERNIKKAVEMVKEVTKLRPHIKTHKSKEICQLLMQHGIKKFKCATISEGELLGMVKAEDALLAFPLVGPKINRFISLVKKYPSTHYSCIVDHKEALIELNQWAEKENLTINFYLDLNVGMNRTGIRSESEAIDLFIYSKSLSNVICIGLHAYDGHIHEKDLTKRTNQCEECYLFVSKVKNHIEQTFNSSMKIVVGGTPTFPIHLKRDNVECSPGTFVFWDEGYRTNYDEQDFIPAALVLARVISCPTPSTFCLDLGYKSIASEKELDGRFTILNEGSYKLISQSEEHIVIETTINKLPKIGEVFYILPRHICPTVALYDNAIICLTNESIGHWSIEARKRKISV